MRSANEVLAMFRSCGLDFPKHFRTLLKIPRRVETEELCGGTFFYRGIECGLHKILDRHHAEYESNEIKLCFNIDGVPLWKSSQAELWPILCSFADFEPFVVALFYGRCKPTSEVEYLEAFLNELDHLIQTGVQINDTQYRITVRCFICDAPARAFIKSTKGHTGFYACERCGLHGRNLKHKTVYNTETLGAERTDVDFSAMLYLGTHQHRRSPLIDHNILCVKQFTLDFMHLVCLGVVKRILKYFSKNKKPLSITAAILQQISQRLVLLRNKMPAEFARQPRGLDIWKRWKATECRQFLLYTGPLCLKGIVSDEVYHHFMRLSVAISILCDTCEARRNTYLNYARELLKSFVRDAKHIYGKEFNVFNVHGLIHIADDVEYFNAPLDDISSFPYENHLGKLKRLVRQYKNPILQVMKRIYEEEVGLPNRSYKRTTMDIVIAPTMRNGWFILPDGSYVRVQREIYAGELYECRIYQNHQIHPMYTLPCLSTFINVGVLHHYQIRRFRTRNLSRMDLNRKVVCLPYSFEDTDAQDLDEEQAVVLLPMCHGREARLAE